ncbi:MAG: redoxin domain-containing protein [bacterium]
MQWVVGAAFSPEQLTILGVNTTSSTEWLLNYRTQSGITFPFAYDQKSELFTKYKIGGTYGYYPPTYIIIDQNGIVRYRIDNTFKRAVEMATCIKGLLTN